MTFAHLERRAMTVGLVLTLALAGPGTAAGTSDTDDAMMPKPAAMEKPMADGDPAQVVAVVGGVEITLGHMIAMTMILPEEQKTGTAAEVFEGVLQRLIQQEAVSQQLDPIPRLVQLQSENERRSLLASALVEEMGRRVVVTEQELQAAYDQRFGGFQPTTEYNASHILVETKDRAMELLTLLRGGVDFATLARANSIGPSGPGGGNIGWSGPGRMLPAFENAAMAMKPGEISEPVETEFGWHVIRLNELRLPDVPTLEEMRGTLEEELRRDRFRSELLETINSVGIERANIDAIDPLAIFNPGLLR